MKKTFQVIEDNGGGLHLTVFNETGTCIYLHSGFELCPGDLTECIDQLKLGEDPSNWEGCNDDPVSDYEELTSFEFGWCVVADNYGIYANKMGPAAMKEFGIESEGY